MTAKTGNSFIPRTTVGMETPAPAAYLGYSITASSLYESVRASAITADNQIGQYDSPIQLVNND